MANVSSVQFPPINFLSYSTLQINISHKRMNYLKFLKCCNTYKILSWYYHTPFIMSSSMSLSLNDNYMTYTWHVSFFRSIVLLMTLHTYFNDYLQVTQKVLRVRIYFGISVSPEDTRLKYEWNVVSNETIDVVRTGRGCLREEIHD